MPLRRHAPVEVRGWGVGDADGGGIAVPSVFEDEGEAEVGNWWERDGVDGVAVGGWEEVSEEDV